MTEQLLILIGFGAFVLATTDPVLAITTDPFVVFTSNVFAILGLRSMFFALADPIHWYAATLDGDPLNRAVSALGGLEGETQRRRLSGMALALNSRANVPMPPAWKEVSLSLYASSDLWVQRQAERMEKVFTEAPFWAFDGGAVRQHFLKFCSQCHKIGNDGARLGPELTGAGRNGIRYFLENVIDPNAVIGADFQLTLVETKAGDVFSGLFVNETPTALTLRTVVDQVVVTKADIARRCHE